jgi:dipeptidyl aminopeptidase/acylaminoacyl peptidase
MNQSFVPWAGGWLALTLAHAAAQWPDNLVAQGVPPIPAEVKADAGRYLEFRSASFQSWHPRRRELLISTRFAEASQLHLVQRPGGARRQLTFSPEPVAGGSFRPKTGDCIVFAQDTGGGEFYQLYRFDPGDARVTRLTDGASRNLGARWSRSGRWLAYTSTRRNGRDTDLYVMDPADPSTDRRLCEVSGGGWAVLDWSWDDAQLLVREYRSINESLLHRVDARSGKRERLTPPSQEKVAYGAAQFAKDGRSVYLTTDQDAEFQRLAQLDLATQRLVPLTAHIPWDVEEFDLSPDGKILAFVTNEDGANRLRLLDVRSRRELRAPRLPLGVLSGLSWHENGRDLAFSLSSAQAPTDVFSLDRKTGRLERWTESETGGLDSRQFVEPELVKVRSFDGVGIPAFVYRPHPQKFPGPRPVVINIHGGPEGQAQPVFQARNNYYLSELGVAVVYPNVRGSSGYGKTFLTLDNGFKREDAVRDLGAILEWIRRQPNLDAQRVGVMGGSYGGYMALAAMIHFGEQLRCGVDVVGISNFLTFLRNTQDYRRDLRRVEYGDERDPQMAAFLERISPTTRARQIAKPLFVVQGKNDPRVPATESEQMVKAIRDHGGQVWYLMAKDEGHGFQKKRNADLQFLSTILFLREHLLR